MPAKSIKAATPKVLDLKLGAVADMLKDHELLMGELATVRSNIEDLVLTGFDGTYDAHCEGETFGFEAAKLPINGILTVSLLEYAFMREKPSIAVYDRTYMRPSGKADCHWTIVAREALLAVIRLKL